MGLYRENRLLPTTTANRIAWLRRLAISPASRGRGRTGYDCMQLGWTEWNYVDRHGVPISYAEAVERWGLPDVFAHISSQDERLTAAGRKVLEDYDERRQAEREQLWQASRAANNR